MVRVCLTSLVLGGCSSTGTGQLQVYTGCSARRAISSPLPGALPLVPVCTTTAPAEGNRVSQLPDVGLASLAPEMKYRFRSITTDQY